MLEVLARIVCTVLMICAGYYTISNITGNDLQKLNIKAIILLSILTVFTVLNYKGQYNVLFSISIFLLNVLIYKAIFNLNIESALMSVSIFMIILFFSDMIISACRRIIFNIEKLDLVTFLLANITVSAVTIMFIRNNKIKAQIQKFYKNMSSKRILINLIFLIFLVLDFCLLAYNFTRLDIYNINFTINLCGMIIFGFMGYTYIKNSNDYSQLSKEYDTLFTYIQNFEDWIEKEQLNRHEYKNQLAVLRCLTKEKKVKNKIDEILEDNINIDEQAVTNFKNLPKGGIKGLMYYKSAIAEKQKINLTTDVYLEKDSILAHLSEKKIKSLCKLIGIYFDNAIEAAAESRKKNLTIEIYEFKDKVKFVFSNTFKNHKNMKNINQKGVSSKGLGRGNGLYFASKIIKENKWIESKQEIIDNYYIQQLSIKNKK